MEYVRGAPTLRHFAFHMFREHNRMRQFSVMPACDTVAESATPPLNHELQQGCKAWRPCAQWAQLG